MWARSAGAAPPPFLNMIPAIPHMSSRLPLAFENAHDNRKHLCTATG